MNKENLIKTRDAILAHKERFVYGTFFSGPLMSRPDDLLSEEHTCGTVGCVAGFAAGLAMQEGYEVYNSPGVVPIAKQFLRIETGWATPFLFYAEGSDCIEYLFRGHPKFRHIPKVNLSVATYEDAVDRLNLLIDLCE